MSHSLRTLWRVPQMKRVRRALFPPAVLVSVWLPVPANAMVAAMTGALEATGKQYYLRKLPKPMLALR